MDVVDDEVGLGLNVVTTKLMLVISVLGYNEDSTDVDVLRWIKSSLRAVMVMSRFFLLMGAECPPTSCLTLFMQDEDVIRLVGYIIMCFLFWGRQSHSVAKASLEFIYRIKLRAILLPKVFKFLDIGWGLSYLTAVICCLVLSRLFQSC